MKKSNIIFSVIVLVAFIGCNKSENPSEPISTTSEFKVTFENYSNTGTGAIWLHDSNGKNINNFKSFIDEETIDFGLSEGDRINFTSIITRYSGNKKDYYLRTFYNAPKGIWIFSGQDRTPKGDAQVEISFPNNQYTFIVTSPPGGGSKVSLFPYGQNASNSTALFSNIIRLNTDGTFSCYSYVYDSNNAGYCGWLLNKPFSIGVMNNYQLTLSSNLINESFTSNRQINKVQISALLGDSFDELSLFNNQSFSSSLSTQILVPNSFTANKYMIFASYSDNQQYYSYTRYSNVLIRDITIPTSTVSATIDANKNYNNIKVTGEADEIWATYFYYDAQRDIRYYWDIRTPITSNNITIPEIPSELSTLFPDLDFSNFTRSIITITDFDYAKNYDDAIDIYFRGKYYLEIPIKEIYRYYQY